MTRIEAIMVPFEHLTPRLPVTDLSRTITFYRDRLGFRPSVLWPDDAPTFVILERDRASVGFFQSEDPRRGQIGYAELYIRVPDARGLHAELREQVEVEWGPEVYSYGNREFGLRDPDGYLVIFSEPTQDPPTTSEPEIMRASLPETSIARTVTSSTMAVTATVSVAAPAAELFDWISRLEHLPLWATEFCRDFRVEDGVGRASTQVGPALFELDADETTGVVDVLVGDGRGLRPAIRGAWSRCRGNGARSCSRSCGVMAPRTRRRPRRPRRSSGNSRTSAHVSEAERQGPRSDEGTARDLEVLVEDAISALRFATMVSGEGEGEGWRAPLVRGGRRA